MWCLLPVTLLLSGEDMQIGLIDLPANLAEAASCSSVRDVASNKDTTKITKMKSHGERQVAGHLCPHMCMREWVCTHMCMHHIQTHIHISRLWKNNMFMRLILIASLVHKMLLADLTIGDSCLMASVLSQRQEIHH